MTIVMAMENPADRIEFRLKEAFLRTSYARKGKQGNRRRESVQFVVKYVVQDNNNTRNETCNDSPLLEVRDLHDIVRTGKD